jgi:hypothetical protein
MSLIGRDDIKVKVVITNSGVLIARATVILFNVWEEHGWRIMKSTKEHPNFRESVWIQAPCFKTTNNKGESVWKEIVYINDKPTWEFVQEMIYDAYFMARSKKEGADGVKGIENPEIVKGEEPPIIEDQNKEEIPDDISI